MKCDPCVATAPSQQDLVQSGVWWLAKDWNDYSDVSNDNDEGNLSDQVYFTRLHIRYNRSAFPQDLMFQVTPNTENYQARYVIHHPATGGFNCERGRKYLSELKKRRREELQNLMSLTGKSYSDWDEVSNDEVSLPSAINYSSVALQLKNEGDGNKNIVFAAISILGIGSILKFGRRKRNQ
jgi:hypothetical protein